jgi:patatin-like phospholipase/acyl hydrolase
MKKILSIDGGGIRGIIPALVLAELEQKTGKPTSEIFDLVAGTSTGGILALALSQDDGQGNPQYSAKDLIQLYEQEGKNIFPKSVWQDVSTLGGLAEEKYPRQGIDTVLARYFGSARLGSCLTKTVVTTYDIENREPLFLKSWRPAHQSIKAVDAARATSAAPTYFAPVEMAVENKDRVLIDGGIFINTPSVSAYVEALRIFPDEKDFLVVSLGTGELNRPIPYRQAKDWGVVEWLSPLLSCVFDGVCDAANYQMSLLLEGNYYRLQTWLDKAVDEMDNVSDENMAALKAEAATLLREHQDDIQRLCSIL